MKKLVLAIVAAYIVLMLTNYLVHEVWLMSDYAAIPASHRSPAGIMHRFWAMAVGQFFSGGRSFFNDLNRKGQVLSGQRVITVQSDFITVDGSDGAAAKITQLQDVRQYAGALLFEGGERLRQGAPSILAYSYVRIITTKNENC